MNSVASFVRPLARRLTSLMARPVVFWLAVAFFVISSVWLSLSGTFPMIFDEEYHLGIIDIYSRQLSPFIPVQPSEAAVYGDITRYSSYIYHYVASFPYRFIKLFTNDLEVAVTILRFINVAIMTAALIVYRKIFQIAKVSHSLIHFTFMLFVGIPLVPLATAQVSYDPLAIFCSALLIYYVLKVLSLPGQSTKYFVYVTLLGSYAILVKFTLLPIFAASFMVALGSIIWRYRTGIIAEAVSQLKKLPLWLVIGLGVLLIGGVGLCLERYGINAMRYHTLTPDCAQIQPSQVCLHYGPWQRNSYLEQQQDIVPVPVYGPVGYSVMHWLPNVIQGLFVVAVYPQTERPLELHTGAPSEIAGSSGQIVIRAFGWSVALIGLVCALIYRKYLWQRYRLIVVAIAIMTVYIMSLWLRNYSEYLAYGAAVATQGRYLLPLLPFVLLAIVISVHRLVKNSLIRALVIILTCFVGLCGAGAVTYIIYADPQWHWPLMRPVNEYLTSLLHFLR